MPGPYRIWPATDGPSSVASDNTAYTLGVEFYVTASGLLLYGFWWWCAPGADTGPKPMTLYEAVSDVVGTPVDGASAMSGTLTADAWNYTALDAPVPLVADQHYRAGILGGGTANWYAASAAYFTADLANGPLVAPSTADALGQLQGSFVVGSTPAYPRFTGGGNYWLDVSVSEAAVLVQSGTAGAGLPTGPSAGAGLTSSAHAGAGLGSSAYAQGGVPT